ncbi:UNKNOWN [Stylonychia lemnae]|uniref:Uncharacterized protein n=1 Tax=Stylonychia lemnae TaxID=5949 RepID=A0A078ASR7_STYLE|nr:UNKNOWN [Stylonychia lemnae]|eukprot:CDW85229.1 UNKNOWN [Stylonychia lemnae]
MLRQNTTGNIQTKLANNKKTLNASYSSKLEAKQQTIFAQRRVVAPTYSNQDKENFTNSAILSNKRQDKMAQKDKKLSLKQKKKMNTEVKIRMKSRVRFAGQTISGAANEFRECKSIKSDRSSILTIKDERTSRKRNNSSHQEKNFSSPGPSQQKRARVDHQISCGNSTNSTGNDSFNPLLSSAASSGQTRQSIKSSVTVSSFSQLPMRQKTSTALKEEARRRAASKIKHEVIQFEDKISGHMLDFNIYEERDLPFMNQNTDMGVIIRKTIIDGDVDDDCATDGEQRNDAKDMLKNELASAINKYLSDKRDGTQANFIKNINPMKRFQRSPFC